METRNYCVVCFLHQRLHVTCALPSTVKYLFRSLFILFYGTMFQNNCYWKNIFKIVTLFWVCVFWMPLVCLCSRHFINGLFFYHLILIKWVMDVKLHVLCCCLVCIHWAGSFLFSSLFQCNKPNISNSIHVIESFLFPFSRLTFTPTYFERSAKGESKHLGFQKISLSLSRQLPWQACNWGFGELCPLLFTLTWRVNYLIVVEVLVWI